MLTSTIKKLPLFIVLFFTFAFIHIDPDIQSILDRLKKFQDTHSQEKVYLHTNQPFYSIGDTVYFKAYLTNAENNLPSSLSKILYVELLDDQDLPVTSLKLRITNGIAWGTLPLEDSLSEGNYLLRAYTNRMRNADETFFFHKNIMIGNAFDNQPSMKASIYFDSSTNKMIANISYTALQKNSVAAKEVNFSIFDGDKEILSSKGITSQDGQIAVTIPALTGGNTYELATIIKIDKDNTVSKKTLIEIDVERDSIKFCPEGGQLVNGLPAKLGIEAFDKKGNGIKLTGEIVNEQGDKIADFATGFAGTGSVEFTPQAGHHYAAVAKYPHGRREKFILPKAKNEGYTFSIGNTDNRNLNLQISEKGTGAKEMILIGHCGNNIVAAQKLIISNGTATLALPKAKLPTGISHFTVFDAAGKPVAERLVFINNDDHLEISLKVLKKEGKMTLALDAKDEFGDPVQGSFSVAVTNGNTVKLNDNSQTIVSNLLLEANLEGTIRDPGYFFTDINKGKLAELDDLLLTRRWRRFDWGDVLSGNYREMSFKTEHSLAVTGKVISASETPVPNAKVTLLSKTGEGFILDTITNEKGEFTFDRLNLQGEMFFAIKAVGGKGDKNLFIILDNTTLPKRNPAASKHRWEYVTDSSMTSYLKNSSNRFNEMRKYGLLDKKTITLKEIILTTKEPDPVKEALKPSWNLNGPGHADQVLTYHDLTSCNDLIFCLSGKVREVSFKQVIINGIPYVIPYSTNAMGKAMLIVLDGQPFNPLDGSFSLMNFNARDVQSVEVLRTPGFVASYGMMGSGGVLVITTKRGGIDYEGLNDKMKKNALPPKGVLFFKFNGFASDPGFTNYNLPTALNSQNTIYWKPDIVTDENGHAVIEFPVTGTTTKYNVVIEGMSGEGKLGTARFTIDNR